MDVISGSPDLGFAAVVQPQGKRPGRLCAGGKGIRMERFPGDGVPVENLPGIAVEAAPAFGEGDFSPLPFEKNGPEFTLEFLHILSHGGLGDVQ